jgi:signal transduction histidine kinase
MNWLDKLGRQPRSVIVVACLGFVALIGLTDFLTGFEIFFSVFYLLAVSVGTWFVGRRFGFFLAALSAGTWIIGDFAAGAHYSSSFIPIWNSAILLAFYVIVVWLVASLRALQSGLEKRVQQRTLELTREMMERERLEKEILDVSEREQRRIGRDLHDSLCQHFTGTALACRVLEERLAARGAAEASDVENIIGLVEDGITMARGLARGISPVDMEAEGLVAALHVLAANLTKISKVQCIFESDPAVFIPDATTATHLYRITQEAVSNAMRHGKAGRIDINLSARNQRMTLTVEDDGVGLRETWQSTSGLGTRIMAHRATMIGADFSIEPNPTGGTLVTCSLPVPVEADTGKESR